MKHYLFTLIMAVMAVVVPQSVVAHDFEAVNADGKAIYYRIVSDTECAVTYSGTGYMSVDEYAGHIAVPAVAVNAADGKTRNVTTIDSYAFSYSSVESITISEGITTLMDAISNANKLKRIVFPASFTTLDDNPFDSDAIKGRVIMSCPALEEVVWNAPQYVNTFEMPMVDYTNCKSLKRIVFGEGVISVPAWFARGFNYLNSVVIPQTVQSVGNDAFYNCRIDTLYWNAAMCATMSNFYRSDLKSVVFGNAVQMIPANLCNGASRLKSVVIPASVQSIGNNAFYGCSSLYEIYNLGQLPLQAGSDNFGQVARYAKVIHTSTDEPSVLHTVGDYDLVLIDDTVRVLSYNGSDAQVVMPQSFTVNGNEYRRYILSNGAFNNKNNVTGIALPDSIIGLEEYSLRGSAITQITIPRALEWIGGKTVFPSTLKTVVWNAVECRNTFEYWNGAELLPEEVVSLTVADDVEVIPAGFICNNKNITVFTFPKSLREIGTTAFAGCTSLAGKLSLPPAVEVIGLEAFRGATGYFGELVIPESVDSIGNSAFENTSFTSVQFNAVRCATPAEDSRVEIFNDCKQLFKFTFGDGVKRIPDAICRNVTTLTTPVVIPAGVEEIGRYAFDNTGTALGTTLVLPQNLRKIGSGAFGVDNIRLIKWDAREVHLEKTWKREQWYTGTLKAAIHFAATVDSIPENLFYDNPEIDSIYYDIPDLKRYPAYEDYGQQRPAIFDNMSDRITKIGIGESVRRIPRKLFSELKNVKQVQLPATVEDVGCEAFNINTKITAEKPYGPTVAVNASSVDTWTDVYLYAETVQYFDITTETDGVVSIEGGLLKPFGERPGLRLEEPYAASLSMEYCQGMNIEISNGTDKTQMVKLPELLPGIDTVFCRLTMQTGTDIQIIFETEDSGDSDLTPGSATKRVVLTDEGYSETFADNSMGDFTEFVALKVASLDAVWKTDMEYVKGTAYFDGQNSPSEAWLVSPEFDCSAVEHLILSFEHTLGYTNTVTDITQHCTLKATADGTVWTDVPITTYPAWGAGSKWWNFLKCSVDLGEYMSPTTRFAFVYKSSVQCAPTWEIKNLVLSTAEQTLPDAGFGEVQLPIVRSTKLLDFFYDLDGDSVMEYVYHNQDDNVMQIYTYRGQLKDNFVVEEGLKLHAIEDIDRNGVADLIWYRDDYDADDNGQVYIMPYDTRVMRPLADAKHNAYNALFDANADGRTDYYVDIKDNNSAEDYIYYQQPDGSFIRTDIQVVTDEDEILSEVFAQSGANVVLPPPVHFGGAALARAPRPQMARGTMQRAAQNPTPMYSPSAPIAVDVNRDGMPDLLNLYNYNSLISLGDGRYYYGSLFGNVTVGDFNSDGIQDFIIFDPESKTVYLYIYDGDNKFSKQVLVQNMALSQVKSVDIDHDGDLDILLAFDWTKDSHYAMIVLYRNDGGKFVKREHAFAKDRGIRFFDVADVDGDGTYEMVCGEGIPDETNADRERYFLADCTPQFTISENAPFLDSEVDNAKSWDDIIVPDFVMGDFDNDGNMEYLRSNMRYVNDNYQGATVWRDLNPYVGRFERSKANTAPARMPAPTYMLDAASGMLKVEWQQGSDAETSACDLTYSVRVGTQPGSDDILHGVTSVTGSRLRVGEGNIGADLFTILDIRNWARGDYYIAVQAVDKEGLAGAWSDELAFAHNTLYAAFEMNYARLFTADTLVLTLSTPYNAALTYEWSLGDNAAIVDQQQGTWRVVFNRAEELDINLRVSAADGSYADAEPHHLVVLPIRFVRDHPADAQYESDYHSSSGTYFDVDFDGTVDLLGSSTSGGKGLQLNDGKNRFTSVPRMFNLDFDPGNTKLVDFNLDGYPDFYSSSKKGDVFINTGADNDFEYSTRGVQFVDPQYPNYTKPYFEDAQIVDIDLDGRMDFIKSDNVLYLNSGDNIVFNKMAMPNSGTESYDNRLGWVDYDRDGLLDLIVERHSEQYQYNIYWYRNAGNGSFDNAQRIGSEPLVFYHNYIKVDDIDADGYYDFVGRDNSATKIYWGSADGQFAATAPIADYGSIVQLFDYDNNGLTDIKCDRAILFQLTNREFMAMTTDDAELPWEDVRPLVDLNGDGCPDAGEYVMQTSIANSAPEVPANIKAVQDGGSVVLSWDDALDAETPYTAMRYNISVRRVGASGENSYVISPMNGGSNTAAATTDIVYVPGNTLKVPASRFIVGEEYEVMVQAIDGWYAHSPFSEPFIITVESEVGIQAPTEACTGIAATAVYAGTETGTPQWRSDGASITTNGNSADFTWSTPGVKTIECTVNGITSSRAITVAEGPDMTFTLPQKVLSSAYVYFTLPEAFADSRNRVTYRHSYNPEAEAAPMIPTLLGGWMALPVVKSLDEPKITVERRGKTLDARMQVNVPDGQYWIEFVCTTEACGEIVYRQSFAVEGDNVTPEISIVTMDAATGKNVINWQAPANLPNTDLYTDMVIFREEGATNNFVQLGEVPIAAGQFVDMASDPSMRKYRYRIALKTYYGGISTPSVPHSSVHVMLNRGLAAGSVNIVWTPYEGGTIEQYTILRGTSPDNMQTLTTASGYEQSYTDFTCPEGDVYYALSYTNTYDNGWGAIASSRAPEVQYAPRAALNSGRSNAVNANRSSTITQAKSLKIRHVEKTLVIDEAQPSIHLYAEILPGAATYKTVSWQVTAGQNLVSVTSSGLVTYSGSGAVGNATVKATTVDGSNISATITIPIKGFTADVEVTSVVLSAGSVLLNPSQRTINVQSTVLPENATNKNLTWSVVSGHEVASVNQSGVVTAQGKDGSAVIRATAGNGVYGELTVTATGFEGTGDVVLANALTVYATDSPTSTTAIDPIITPTRRRLYVKANIEPADVTVKEFSLELLSGGDKVSVTNMGAYYMVEAAERAADGTVGFRARTMDGTDITQSLTIELKGFATDVETVEDRVLVLYPVPACDILYIDTEYPIASVQMVASDGTTVYSANEPVTAINVSSLPEGVYHLQIVSAGGTLLNRHIVITR